MIKNDPLKLQYLFNSNVKPKVDESALKYLISRRKSLSSQNKQEKWGYLVTRIIDTGMGIKKDKLIDLFSTFKK
jgi:hypothetical protein